MQFSVWELEKFRNIIKLGMEEELSCLYDLESIKLQISQYDNMPDIKVEENYLYLKNGNVDLLDSSINIEFFDGWSIKHITAYKYKGAIYINIEEGLCKLDGFHGKIYKAFVRVKVKKIDTYEFKYSMLLRDEMT